MLSSTITDDRESQCSFWADYLSGFATAAPIISEIPCELPCEEGRKLRRSSISEAFVKQLSRLAKDSQVSETAIWESIWCVLLSRYISSETVAIGVSNAGHCERLQRSWVPLRVPIEVNDSVIDLAQRIENLRSVINLASAKYSPPPMPSSDWNLSLFESAFRLQRDSVVTDSTSETVTPSIVVSVLIDEGGCQLQIDFDGTRYSKPSIDRMLTHMSTLVCGIVKEPSQLIRELPLLSAAERGKVIDEWNATESGFPDSACLHDLFEHNVACNPHSVAVLWGDERVTYDELDQRANQLAHLLKRQGIQHESRVGLCADRSVDMVVGMLGILKAGAAFVPIDPSYPADRLAFMIADSDVDVLLSQQALRGLLPETRAQVICLDDQAIFENQSTTKVECEVSASSLAYLIYTSGSTGIPKGIALQHQGVVNNLVDLNSSFGIGPSDRTLAISSLSFDMCVYEVLGTLAAGGGIVMPDPALAKEPAHWAGLIARHEVTVWNSAPQLLEMLINYVTHRSELHPRRLKVAILGGDWAPVSLPERLREISPEVKLVVLGGATEASIHSIVFPVNEVNPAWRSIPYGRPMANQKAFILDPNLQPVPIGVPGELHIGGVGLARGYFDREELTRERFIANPFSQSSAERMYKTGDLARWMPDGNIELLGRMDHQVKIRGHRIELGEIEAALRSQPEVEDAVVMARDDEAGTKRLVSYIVPSESVKATVSSDDVDRWRVVYNETYSGSSESTEPSRDFVGWISSFTGEPFSNHEMDEVVDTTVRRILALEPKRVYEIGCGTGLIMFGVAPECSFYEGADLSSVVLKTLSGRVEQAGLDASRVRLVERVADDLHGVERNAFDTIIINSVSQHFPDIDYLIRVVRGAVSILRTDGRIFLGDLRCLPLLKTFHTSIELTQADGSQAVGEVRKRVERRIRHEKELWIDPQLFEFLLDEVPEIKRVSIQLRRGSHHNEMNQFHYDVTLNLADDRDGEIGTELDWNEHGLTLELLRQRLEMEKPGTVRLKEVPNARLRSFIEAQRRLEDAAETQTIDDLSRDEIDPAKQAVDPEDLWQLENDGKYHVDVRWPRSGKIDCFDVLISCTQDCQRTDGSALLEDSDVDSRNVAVAPVPPADGCEHVTRTSEARPLSDFGNVAKAKDEQEHVTPLLRATLERRLPGYMVPSVFVYLSRLPLTPNGKVDRKSLPVPDNERQGVKVDLVRPTTSLETFLVGLWAESLALTEVGVDDNFFDLGGHSLTATRIISHVNEVIPLRVSLRSLFENPSVGDFARELERRASDEGLDIAELAEVLVHVGQLSDDEVNAAIAKGESHA